MLELDNYLNPGYLTFKFYSFDQVKAILYDSVVSYDDKKIYYLPTDVICLK